MYPHDSQRGTQALHSVKQTSPMCRRGQRRPRFPTAVVVRGALLAVALANTSPAHATLTATGDVSPTNPIGWTRYTTAYVGNSGVGGLVVDSGGKLFSKNIYIGKSVGSNGSVLLSDTGSTWENSENFHVGFSGDGTLSIASGGKVTVGVPGFNPKTCAVGYGANSDGTLTIDGNGSLLNFYNLLDVGLFGRGAIVITDGGKLLSTQSAAIGYAPGAKGSVVVDGSESTWSLDGDLYVGFNGIGALAVSHGGMVAASRLTIPSSSRILTLNVGDTTLVTLNNEISNSGIVRLKAASCAVALTSYTPIVTNTWSGTGIVQPLGGTWNTDSHTFKVSQLANGAAGQAIDIDRSQIQRLRVTDGGSGRQAMVNVLPSGAAANLSLTAATLTPAQLALLQSAITPATSVLGGWTFDATGYAGSDPVYLSLSVGPGFKRNNLALWRLSGDAWGSFSPVDFSYDGLHASFTDTGFAGYAVTVAAIHGDVNCDGKVDAFDLNALAAKWQQGNDAFWMDGDFNGDGKVDAFDLNLLAGNWQAGSLLTEDSRLSTQGSIPEPATLALVVPAILSLLRRRWSHAAPARMRKPRYSVASNNNEKNQ